jgi:hypothetical protein
MSPALRQSLTAAATVAIVALSLGGAVSAALSLRSMQATVAELDEQAGALQAREARLGARPGGAPVASREFQAGTITQAGAALQQRVGAVIAGAKGRLISSRVDIETHSAERRIALAAELSIAEPDLQSLLFELETGRPCLFVDSLEARAAEASGDNAALRVSLSVSGQWSGAK